MRWTTSVTMLLLLAVVGCDPSGGENGGDGWLAPASSRDRMRLDRIAVVYQSGDLETAIPQLEGYTTEYPKDELAWTILGNAYESAERIEEAQAAYDKALEIEPRMFQAITGLGILHRQRGDYDAAMECYERAVEIDPTYAEAYSSMTVIALKRNDDKAAVRYAQKGYALSSSEPGIAANLAVAYHYDGQFQKRDEMTERAEELGYGKIDVLKQIYAGEVTVRD